LHLLGEISVQRGRYVLPENRVFLPFMGNKIGGSKESRQDQGLTTPIQRDVQELEKMLGFHFIASHHLMGITLLDYLVNRRINHG
jgi:hypothetical protein